MASEDRAVEINSSDDDDEALRIAIAMSLGQDPPPPKRNRGKNAPLVDLTEDAEEHSGPVSIQESSSSGGEGVRQAPIEAAPRNSLANLGLDRRKMEEERLERLRKRKASELGQEDHQARPNQRVKIQDGAKAAGSQTPFSPPAPQAGEHAKRSPKPGPSRHASRLPFPGGVVKKTWVRGYPRLGDDITIDEVLQKEQLELAVLSSFQWDDEWLMSKVDISRTKLLLVAFAADESQVSRSLASGKLLQLSILLLPCGTTIVRGAQKAREPPLHPIISSNPLPFV